MDLRVKRTINSIKAAFLELRKKKSLDKISIKELSESAMINKATFYLHYHDIYELSDKLKNEVINRIIDEVRGLNFNHPQNDSKLFSETIISAIIRNSNEIKILYSEGDKNHFLNNNQFINQLEDSLKKYIFSHHPRMRNTTENSLLLSFLIQGAFHTYIRNTSIRTDVLIDRTTDMMAALVNAYTF